MTNKQIAERLCLSAHTVITHRRNIAGKLQIHSPAGLTIYAIVNKVWSNSTRSERPSRPGNSPPPGIAVSSGSFRFFVLFLLSPKNW